MQAVTHSGKFHADDVLAWALLQHFSDEDYTLIRTRDPEVMKKGDLVFDVGGEYDPANQRFDHHQNEYQGPLSSAGMVLLWLYEKKMITESLFKRLQKTIVSYVDDVDNGRTETIKGVPCFSRMVDALNHGAQRLEEFDIQFHKAALMAKMIIEGIASEEKEIQETTTILLKAMSFAVSEKRSYIELPRYLPWQPTYFANGGKDHPTAFILFPTMHKTWQVLAIPPQESSFGQKVSFPLAWAGLRDEEFSKVTGEASIFCHKNRFIAVFHSREAALNSLRKFNLL